MHMMSTDHALASLSIEIAVESLVKNYLTDSLRTSMNEIHVLSQKLLKMDLFEDFESTQRDIQVVSMNRFRKRITYT